jgi:glycosyltransferase involved in cell wall biosynthesis
MPRDVSVIIPVFNREALVSQAIDSCLAQATDGFGVEVIAVDDGSTDGTLDVLREFGDAIHVIALGRNHGRNRARNTGLQAATGDFVKFLDSDDILVAGALATEVRTARETNADVVVSGWDVVDLIDRGSGDDCRRGTPPHFATGGVIDALLAGNAVPTGAGLYARALVANLRWDEAMRKLDDWDWFVRAALRAKVIATADIVSYEWRQHAAQGVRAETLHKNAIEHHMVLHKLEYWLRANGMLTDARKRRLAQYYYKELRVLAVHDPARFDAAARHIAALDPAFVPQDEERQAFMRWLARAIGFRRAVLAHCSVKRTVRRLQGRALDGGRR